MTSSSTSLSTETTSSSLSEPESKELENLRKVLTEATDQRGRYYSNYLNFAVRFEADDTAANKDTKLFQDLLKSLNLPKAEEVVLKSSDQHPEYTVDDFILASIRKPLRQFKGRTLIMGHYAGHGGIDSHDRLNFHATPTSAQKFGLASFETLWSNRDEFDESDLVMIIDSCYSGTAVRGARTYDRSVEIIAAVEADQNALGNSNNWRTTRNNTFTSRLATEVCRKVAKDKSISFSEIVGYLRSQSNSERMCIYCLKLGTVGIRVPNLRELLPTRDAYLQVPDSRPEYLVLFKAHLPNVEVGGDALKKLIEWVHSLDKSLGLTVEAVYKTHSTTILLHGQWHVWAKIQDIPEFGLVCETFGKNQLELHRRQAKKLESSQLHRSRAWDQGSFTLSPANPESTQLDFAQDFNLASYPHAPYSNPPDPDGDLNMFGPFKYPESSQWYPSQDSNLRSDLLGHYAVPPDPDRELKMYGPSNPESSQLYPTPNFSIASLTPVDSPNVDLTLHVIDEPPSPALVSSSWQISSVESGHQLKPPLTCDNCLSAKVKCSHDRPTCSRCKSRREECTYNGIRGSVRLKRKAA